jgi:hypothetical protein
MIKNRFKILWILSVLVGFSLACESLTAIRRDYDEVRSTADAAATQVDQIITQAKGIATEIGESSAIETVKAFATEEGPKAIATGEALATKAAEKGYLETAEALVTQGSSELLPTVQAAATEYLFPSSPPEDVPIITIGEVTNLFTNQHTVSYFVHLDVPVVVNFYQRVMPEMDWTDESDSELIREKAAVLKFSKPDRVANITLTTDPINQQTVVFITISSQ